MNDHISDAPVVALPLRAFCKAYGVGETFARSEIKAGRLQASRLGKKIVVPKASADKWLSALPSAA